MAEGDEERCKHGEVAAWCGESECMAARTRMPVRVWRTKRGLAFHRKPDCEALADGQAMAERYGKEVTEPQQMPLSDAMSAGLGECYHCFPPDVPVNYRHEAGRTQAVKDEGELRPAQGRARAAGQ